MKQANAALSNPFGSVGISVGAHLLLVGLLTLNLSFFRGQADRPVRLAIDAVIVVDADAERQREQAREIEAAAERARLELEAQRERERKAAEQAEQQRVAAERARAAEAEAREAERLKAEADAKAAAKAKAEAAAKAEAERKAREAEERRAAEEAARRAAEAARRKEREAQLLAQLAAEEERQSAVEGGLLDQYREVIRQKIVRSWNKPLSAVPGINCEVTVRQIPGGEVVDVQVNRCNGDAAVVRSIENAVYKASPLPAPPIPSLFERVIIFVFKPDN